MFAVGLPRCTGMSRRVALITTILAGNRYNVYTHDEISLSGDEQRLIGLINRMRLFAPTDVVNGAEAVLKAIVEIPLKPSVELRQLAKQALSDSLDPDPLPKFSSICRADLDNVHRTVVVRSQGS